MLPVYWLILTVTTLEQVFIHYNLYSYVKNNKKDPLNCMWFKCFACMYEFHMHTWCSGRQEGIGSSGAELQPSVKNKCQELKLSQLDTNHYMGALSMDYYGYSECVSTKNIYLKY